MSISTSEPRFATARSMPRAHTAPASELDPWARLERFLLLGCEGSTYRAGDAELSQGHAAIVTACLSTDAPRALTRIVASSKTGRVPKNDPAIFSLAVAAKLGDEQVRRAAYGALPAVCSTGAQLMQFVEYARWFGGWGRGMRKAIAAWYTARSAAELVRELVTPSSVDGWSHRDLLRLAHPRAATVAHDQLFAWAVNAREPAGDEPAFELVTALDELLRIDDPAQAAARIRDAGVPRASVPPRLLHHPEVWDALLETMSIAELVRELPVMTRLGLLVPGAPASDRVVARLRDRRWLAHETAPALPMTLLAALVVYRAGRGARGQGGWLPVATIVDALEAAFHASFAFVEPVGTRLLVALDVSSSMETGRVGGVPHLSPRIASAALALLASATERDASFVAFTEGDLQPLALDGCRLDGAVGSLAALPSGGVDCARPMLWARERQLDVDTFVILTDHETWAGDVPPAQALRDYRDARGIPAKLIVVGMTSDGFALADPLDAGMLDVVGFDASTPSVLADFARA